MARIASPALLSRAGADIGQLNAVRKHLSKVKGGRLAAASKAGRLISLILSDVVGNGLDVIASGPTAADPTTFGDAMRVLRGLGMLRQTPRPVVEYLEAGDGGRWPETLKVLPGRVTNVIIGDNGTAMRAAGARAVELGYSLMDLGSAVTGESWDAGRAVADMCLSVRGEAGRGLALCMLSGGETVVSNVAPGGKGGRNQEYVLAAADSLLRARSASAAAVRRDVLILSAGTDGEDGPTDAAGAFVDEGVLDAAAKAGLAPEEFRRRSRSYDFFERGGGLVRTGPTGTNVMDLRVALVR